MPFVQVFQRSAVLQNLGGGRPLSRQRLRAVPSPTHFLLDGRLELLVDELLALANGDGAVLRDVLELALHICRHFLSRCRLPPRRAVCIEHRFQRKSQILDLKYNY